jgi:quinoprotein glucose dehydrogenase
MCKSSYFLPFLFCFALLLGFTCFAGNLEKMPNKLGNFKGASLHEAYQGYTWVAAPYLKGPASMDIDPKGRVFVSEARRMGKGVPDNRRKGWRIYEDYRLKTVEDRLDSYQRNQHRKPMEWYEQEADQVLRFVDTDGNGAPDQYSVFDDRCRETADGIGFSLLAEEDAVYFTCIPALRKLVDKDDDGKAEEHHRLVEGFGVRVCFKGHDLHGITRGPDGRLYFSVGDRGYSVMNDQGERLAAPSRGAIFRCDDDGSNFEVYAHGLRNPQEISFDEYGNLFTFDNTGDFGDKARVVYVLDNTDSGWTADYQSHHQHVTYLDWGKFHIWQAMWVGESMFDLHKESSPQWVYPPIGHVGNGPSGVTYMTGPAVPDSLRGKFLMCNYRGSPTRSEVLAIPIESKGAGFSVGEVSSYISGLNASDVELGYDGKVYLVEFGSGWSPDDKGSVQVAHLRDLNLTKKGDAVAQLFEQGFKQRSIDELINLLAHSDQRVRQSAQFALVKKGKSVLPVFKEIIAQAKPDEKAPLHAVWGVGQFARAGYESAKAELIECLNHKLIEIRANAARLCGDLGLVQSKAKLVVQLKDSSPRVSSLAAIALGRVASAGDDETITALLDLATRNSEGKFDVTTRHAVLSALCRLSGPEKLSTLDGHSSSEVRLLAVIALRRLEYSALGKFLQDENEQVKLEALRAIFDTSAVDTAVGQKLLKINYGGLPPFIQARLLVAAARQGDANGFAYVMMMATDSQLDKEVQKLALHALQRWDTYPEMDPFLGSLRPVTHDRIPVNQLVGKHVDSFLTYLKQEKRDDFATLATEVSATLKIRLDADHLRTQLLNRKLSGSLRVSFFDRLLETDNGMPDDLLSRLFDDPSEQVRALALGQGYLREIDAASQAIPEAVRSPTDWLVAREAIKRIGEKHPEQLIEFWTSRSKGINPAVWLDLYNAMTESQSEKVRNFAKSYHDGDPARIHPMTITGGDAAKGEAVFRNQGACVQCHKMNGEGGEQGPDLSLVGIRLKRQKLMESVIYPSAEITPGYGLTTVQLKSGDMASGRLISENKEEVVLAALDGKEITYPRTEIAELSPPISAMPAMGAMLAPQDLRDLVSYLASARNFKVGKGASLKHGE